MHAEAPDHELVRIAADRNRRLFARALSLTGDRVEAADLVQDTLLKGLRALGRFRPGSNMAAWLLRIMVNLFIDRHRQARVRPWLVPLSPELPGESPPEPLADPVEPTPEDVRRAVAALAPDLRRTYQLRVTDGLTYEQISLQLGVPMRTIGTRLLRARQQLRRQLFTAVRCRSSERGEAAAFAGRSPPANG